MYLTYYVHKVEIKKKGLTARIHRVESFKKSLPVCLCTDWSSVL
jgi:hypothetical protein